MRVSVLSWKLRKLAAGVLPAAVLAWLLVLANPGSGYSATYTELVINPQHVGVFWQNQTQEFKAWGRYGSGPDDWENITEDVRWESSDESIVTINDAGVATLVRSWGTVDITATYPKKPRVDIGPLFLLKRGAN